MVAAKSEEMGKDKRKKARSKKDVGPAEDQVTDEAGNDEVAKAPAVEEFQTIEEQPNDAVVVWQNGRPNHKRR